MKNTETHNIIHESDAETARFKFERHKSTVSEQELQEACEWHKLFNAGWITAHKLSLLPTSARPEKEGQLFKIETENLQEIATFMNQSLADSEFQECVSNTIRRLLPRVFKVNAPVLFDFCLNLEDNYGSFP